MRCPACGASTAADRVADAGAEANGDADFTIGDEDWESRSRHGNESAPHEPTRQNASESTGPSSRDRQTSSPPQWVFGDYVIEREVARGGMGVVYRARDKKLQRVVALKMIRSAELAGPDEIKRFQVEAEAAAVLDHPTIVPIYDFGELDGQHFYTMGYIDGKSLAVELLDGPLAPRDAATLLALLAEAMQYAHTKGVVHRDLKPGNILLVEQHDGMRGSKASRSSRSVSSSVGLRSVGEAPLKWQPRITDFGLAKQTQSDSELTSTGQVLGTPSYMPPEQARGDVDVGPAADVYALGAVLYATLVGRPPFQAASAVETIRLVLEQDPVPPSRFSASLSRDLDNICLKCLEKTPSRRYGTATELADDLFAFLDGRPVKARPIGAIARFTRWCRRKPMAAAALLAGGAAVLAVFVLVLVASELRVAREKSERWRREGELRQEQLDAAEQRAEAERKMAATQEFFAILSQVRERNAYRQAGWAYQGQDDMHRALALQANRPDPEQLREVVAACITGLDARVVANVPMLPGYRSHRVAVAQQHQRFAVATLKNRLQLHVVVCDYPSGKRTHSLFATPRSLLEFDGIRHVEFLDGGETVAVITRTGFLHRWSLGKAKSNLTTVAIPYKVDQRIVLDNQGARALLCHQENLYLWPDFESDETKLLAKGVDRVWDVEGGSLAAIRREGNLQVVDIDSMEVIYQWPGSNRGWLDRQQRLTIDAKGQLVMVDPRTGETLQEFSDPLALQVHDGHVRQVDVSPDGSILVSGGADQKVTFWDVASGDLMVSVFFGGDDQIFPAFASNRHVVSTGDMEGVVIELNGRNVSGAVAVQHQIDSFDISTSPHRIVAGGMNKQEGATITIWDGSGAEQLRSHRIDGGVVRPIVRTNDQATHFAVGTQDANRIWAWHDSGELAPHEPLPVRSIYAKRPKAVEVDSSGVAWFVEVGDQLVRRTPDELKELSRWSNAWGGRLMGNGRISSLTARADRVTALMMSGQLVVFSTKDQSVLSKAPVQLGGVALAVHPEQTLAAYGTMDGSIDFVPLEGTQEIDWNDQSPHLDYVTSLAFSGDGRLLASSSRDRTICLWQVHADPQEAPAITCVLKIRLPRVALELRFAPNGDLLAALQQEAGLRVWKLDQLRQQLAEFNLDW